MTELPEEPTLETARSGRPTLRIHGRYLHSRTDPEREAARSMEDIARREPPAIVLLGLGLGYHAHYIIDHTELTNVLAFEPSERVIALADEAWHGRAAGHESRLHVVSTVEELARELPSVAAEGFEVVRLAGRENDPAIDEAAHAVRAFSSRLEINHNTLNRFGRLWVRNLCRNSEIITRARGVSELAGLCDGVPALVLAAGPTLDQVLPELSALAERVLIIAVDTALAPCIRAGVVPDIAVVVDPQYWNARHLDRLVPAGTVLVSEPSAHPRVFRAFEEPVYLCSSVFPLGQMFESILGSFGTLGAGGSVSTTAWDLARLLDCPEIYVAGLDLGFPDGKTHCRGSFFEELALALGSRFAPAEATIFRYVWGAAPERVEANNGTTLLSDRRMEIYRSWFASHVGAPGAPKTTALTRGSAAIAGVATAAETFAQEIPARPEKLRAVRNALRRREPVRRDRSVALAGHIRSLGASVGDLAAIAGRALHIIDRISRDTASGRPAVFDALIPIDHELGNHPASSVGSFLMQEAIAAVRSGYGSGSIDEQIEASRRLYTELQDAARFHATELLAAADRLETEAR